MNFIDEIKEIYGNNLKDEIREVAKNGGTEIYYVTEILDPSDAKNILGEVFTVERMTYDTLIIKWDVNE